MKKIFFIFLLLLSSNAFCFADEFQSVRCGEDISKAMLGKRMKNEAVMKTEANHKEINLKHNYGCGEDGVCVTSWNFCGSEYLIAYNKAFVVTDVLQFPPHSKITPSFSAFSGECQMNGKKIAEEVMGVLNQPYQKGSFSAKAAWKTDTKSFNFVKIPVENLTCETANINSN